MYYRHYVVHLCQGYSCSMLMLLAIILHVQNVPYSRKISWGIKFGGVAIYLATASLKSANTLYLHVIYV